MRTSIWYRRELQIPDHSGYYFTYRGWGMGGKADGDSDYGYSYYDRKRDCWRQYERFTTSDSIIVYYWTDADPHQWVEDDPPSIVLEKMHQDHNVTLTSAWADLQKAIERYNIVKSLVEQ